MLKHLLAMYSVKKMSAKDFCISCHYMALAGTPGGDFAQYALAPDQSSTGAYQRHLDRVLPTVRDLLWQEVPCTTRARDERGVLSLPILAMHETIAREVRETELLQRPIRMADWPPAYRDHPVVARAVATGRPLPVPLGFYLDSVRFSAPLAGRTDSVLGFWIFSIQTQRRHLIASVRTRDFCRCGCRGWCTIFPLMQLISWSAVCLANGQRPLRYFDNTPLPECLHSALEQFGQDLGCSGVLLWFKGDWAEASHSLGLPAVTAKHAPCPFCTAGKDDMHARYRECSSASWPWPARALSYEQLCRECEIRVRIVSEDDRRAFIGSLEYRKGPRGRGRTIRRHLHLNNVMLLPGDRIVPSPIMLDTRVVDDAPLPLTVLLWRGRFDAGGSCTDAVVNRCPLFSEALGTSPSSSLAIDDLHTLNYGPMMRWTSAAIWRILLRKSWGFAGSETQCRDLAARRLRHHLFSWYDDKGISAERRLGDLTMTMIGDDMGCGIGAEALPHPGCAMKSKAAETQVLFEWALDLLLEYTDIPCHAEMLAAGRALKSWVDICRGEPLLVSRASAQRLSDVATRHLLMCERAQISFVPKHHMFSHSAVRLRAMGNPRQYSTFLDESLNLLLRAVAASAHRANQAWRVLHSFQMIGQQMLTPYIWGRQPDA